MEKIDACSKKTTRGVRALKISPTLHYCAHNSANEAFIVQELCAGTLNDDYVNWNLSKKLSFMLILLNKLQQLRACEIIHCDIKPANILINSSGTDYYYSDYGLSVENNACRGTSNFYAPAEYFSETKLPFG